jgi:hypothetical protein
MGARAREREIKRQVKGRRTERETRVSEGERGGGREEEGSGRMERMQGDRHERTERRRGGGTRGGRGKKKRYARGGREVVMVTEATTFRVCGLGFRV